MDDPRPEAASLTEDRFFTWAEGQDGRYELLEGAVVMQAGATREHERVAKRIFSSLYAQIDEARFDVNKGDFGVRIGAGRGKDTILYPDVVVDRQSADGSERATETAVVVVEVLSASTDLAHHVEKFARYRRCETLRHYVVVSQKDPIAYVWTRTERGWPRDAIEVSGVEGRIELPAVGAAIALADLYRRPRSAHDLS